MNCRMMLELRNPDYTTAMRIIDAINQFAPPVVPPRHRLRARQSIGRSVPSGRDQPDAADVHDRRIADRARHRGAGGHRRAHRNRRDRAGRANLDSRGHARHSERAESRKPPRFRSRTRSARARRSRRRDRRSTSEQTGGQVAVIQGASLRALVAGLNRLGVKPTGIIAILQAIKSAGALQADLVVQ